MTHWFDDLSKSLSATTSRRSALKLAAAGIGLAALPKALKPARSAQAQAAITYPPGWNLVSGPVGSTLNGASGNLYTLQPGDDRYEVLNVSTPLQACWGYWAYFPNGGSLTADTSQPSYSVTPLPG